MRRILLCTLLVGLLYALLGCMNPMGNPLVAPEAVPSVDFEVGVVPVGPGESTGELREFEDTIYCGDALGACCTTAEYLAYIGVHPALFDSLFGEWSAAGLTEPGLFALCEAMTRAGNATVAGLRANLSERGIVVPGL